MHSSLLLQLRIGRLRYRWHVQNARHGQSVLVFLNSRQSKCFKTCLNVDLWIWFYIYLRIKQQVAVHCHAGLGRTGLLIACYLVYSERMTAKEAIHFVRENRFALNDLFLFAFSHILIVIFQTWCSSNERTNRTNKKLRRISSTIPSDLSSFNKQ